MKQTEPTIAMQMEPVAVNAKTAAKLLAISEARLYRWAAVPGFPVIKVGNRLIFPVDGLRRWALEHTGDTVEY